MQNSNQPPPSQQDGMVPPSLPSYNQSLSHPAGVPPPGTDPMSNPGALPPPPSYGNSYGSQYNVSNFPAQQQYISQGPPPPPPGFQGNQPVVDNDMHRHLAEARERNRKRNIIFSVIGVVAFLIGGTIFLLTRFPCTFIPPECNNGTVCTTLEKCRGSYSTHNGQSCSYTAICQ